jgi:hypothetical protein
MVNDTGIRRGAVDCVDISAAKRRRRWDIHEVLVLLINRQWHFTTVEVDRDRSGAAMAFVPACGERLTEMRLSRGGRRGGTVIRELGATNAHILDCFARSGNNRGYRSSVLAATDREHDLRWLDQIVELLRESSHVLSTRIPAMMGEDKNGACIAPLLRMRSSRPISSMSPVNRTTGTPLKETLMTALTEFVVMRRPW